MDREAHMRRAIALSHEHMQSGAGGPFGAVIARGDEVIAEGWNQVTSTNDPTAHAELVAIRRACAKLGRFDLRGCEIFSSCEPCPMCLGGIHWARLDRLWFANDRVDAASIGFDDDILYREVALPIAARTMPTARLLGDEARLVFEAWLRKSDRTQY